jgi:hypothetical protein
VQWQQGAEGNVQWQQGADDRSVEKTEQREISVFIVFGAGVATGWMVRDRIPVGARFSAPVQTGPGAHPAALTMGTGSFPGVKRPGRDVDHPFPSTAEV